MQFILARLTHCKASTMSAYGKRRERVEGILRGCCSFCIYCYLLPLQLASGTALLFLANIALTWLVFCPAVAIQQTSLLPFQCNEDGQKRAQVQISPSAYFSAMFPSSLPPLTGAVPLPLPSSFPLTPTRLPLTGPSPSSHINVSALSY